MQRLLVVEDDESISVPLVRALRRDGYAVEAVASGETAIARLAASRFHLVLLDLGLPGLDGIDVCRHVRGHHPSARIVVLTARSSELDELLGLGAGADDYVTKPFSLAVLLARIRGLLRRDGGGRPATRSPIEVAGLRIDPVSRRAWRGPLELGLSPKEFELLALLATRAGEAVSREDIMAAVWAANWWGSTKTLDVHVGWLRQKLGHPPLITTVRGHGFRLERS